MKRIRSTERIGQRFGRLVVVAVGPVVEHRSFLLCRCDCGTGKLVMTQSLICGKTKSCGCLFREGRQKKGQNTTHGASKTRTYRIWAGIKKRCLNPNDEAYPRYGGRGIRVCERWLSFVNFLADMGDAPDGLEIDRADVDGNYEPGNCRWADLVAQANNKRNNRLVVRDGVVRTVAEEARASGVKYTTAYQRAIRDGAMRRDVYRRAYANEQVAQQIVLEDLE